MIIKIMIIEEIFHEADEVRYLNYNKNKTIKKENFFNKCSCK